MKKKTSERYSILIVPKSRSSIKKIEMGGRAIGVIASLSFAIVTLLTTSIIGTVHYRNAYLATENVRIEAAKYRQDKSELISKISSLEETVNRTGRFAAKLETILKDGDNVQSGLGPIDEEDWLPSIEKLASKDKLMEKTWRSPFNESLSDKLDAKLDKLISTASGVEGRLNNVFVSQQDKHFFWASLPSIWPTRGWVTSSFGDVRSFRKISRKYSGRIHEGIDIAGPYGTPIVTSGDGLVTFSGYRNGYGRMVVIEHGNGISTVYAHCSAVFVDEGRRVNRGVVIAAVGNTGRSTGPHLHYEIRVDGVPTNPLNYIVENM